jgi:hypothetical protein
LDVPGRPIFGSRRRGFAIRPHLFA